jgi:transposase
MQSLQTMRLDVETVQDVALLRQVIHLQEAEIARLHKRLADLVRRLAQAEGKSDSAALQLELLKLSEQLATLQHKMYGPSSEKQPRPQNKQEAAEKKEKQTGHGPTAQPELPHTEQRHELLPAERTCPRCQQMMAEWPGQTEDSEEISVIERRFVVTTHKRQKYRCSCNAAILTAPAPKKLIEGGRYSLSFAVEVAVQKYAEHLPLERQVRQMRRQGLVVTSQTLWDQIYALSQVLLPTYEALRIKVLSAEVVHADETPWKLLDKAPSKTWYVWGVLSEFGTYYHFDPSRGQQVIKGLLAGYKGVVLSDGYAAYQALARGSPEVVLCFCWAHVRRGFLEARPAYPQCERVLELIAALYAVERQQPAYAGLSAAEREATVKLRTERRRAESGPILSEIQRWGLQQEALPQSSLRKAITYMQNLWPGLCHFVEDGRIPLDNNAMERDLRGVVVGRKNHYGSRSERGTKVAAILYSLMETAKHAGLPEQVYLRQAAEYALQNPGAPLLPHALLS